MVAPRKCSLCVYMPGEERAGAGFALVFSPLFQDFGSSSSGCFVCSHQRTLYVASFVLSTFLVVLRRMICLEQLVHSKQRASSSWMALVFKNEN